MTFTEQDVLGAAKAVHDARMIVNGVNVCQALGAPRGCTKHYPVMKHLLNTGQWPYPAKRLSHGHIWWGYEPITLKQEIKQEVKHTFRTQEPIQSVIHAIETIHKALKGFTPTEREQLLNLIKTQL